MLGPFIRGKIRHKLHHLYKHVLSNMKTARIKGSHLTFLFLTRFYVNVAHSNSNPTWCVFHSYGIMFSCQKLTHAYYAFTSYVRHKGHLYEVFLVLAKNRCLTLWVSIVTNIDFLLTISICCQEKWLWELIKWSSKRKCFDLLLNSLN